MAPAHCEKMRGWLERRVGCNDLGSGASAPALVAVVDSIAVKAVACRLGGGSAGTGPLYYTMRSARQSSLIQHHARSS